MFCSHFEVIAFKYETNQSPKGYRFIAKKFHPDSKTARVKKHLLPDNNLY
jgi:hypothetical protein